MAVARAGCLETFASRHATLRYYAETAANGANLLSFHQLLALADEGDEFALAALERQAEYLGKGRAW